MPPSSLTSLGRLPRLMPVGWLWLPDRQDAGCFPVLLCLAVEMEDSIPVAVDVESRFNYVAVGDPASHIS